MSERTSKLTLRFTAVLVTAVSVFGMFSFRTPTAEAAAGCAESRDTALNLVSTGNYVEAAGVDIAGAKVRMLYSSGTGCMWGKIQDLGFGLASGRTHGEVWLERSNNNGATYQRIGRTYNDAIHASVFTSAFNTIGYETVRVCGATAYSNIWESDPFKNTGPELLGSGCSKWFWPARLYPGMYIGHRGFDCLSSQNNRYVLCMQYDGNLVLYSNGRAVWATNTFRTASKLHMQHDGNLVIYDYYGRAVWATGTNRYPNTLLVVQNDGNVVLYSPTGAVWATNTAGR